MEEMIVKKGVFQNDEEYLQEYFEICELFLRKRLCLAKLTSKEKFQSENPKEEANQLNDQVNELNREIKEKDSVFWGKVKNSLSQNSSFCIEEISNRYSLGVFEKRVLLFFLYVEFNQVSKTMCSKDELLFIFDFESSPISKMRNMRYFHDDHVLLKERVLMQNYRRDSIYATGDFLLSPKILLAVSKMLNGEKVEWEEEVKDRTSSSVEDIGYVKAPECALKDVILKEETKERLGLFLDSYKDNKLEDLGAFEKSKKGKGLIFLFYGPPGTGKSMLAEAVAHYLNKKMLMVEYPKITDRWLGETDKHIARIFKSAKASDLVVVMDEADSLLYDRSSFAAQEHDIRFVNIMLQELERFEGIAVLTSNMDVLLDPALERRIGLKIKFEAPDKSLQAEIWKAHIPVDITLSDGVDFNLLAKRYDFPGGNIKNAVLNAIRKISKEKRTMMTLGDLIFGANMEKDGMFYKKHEKRIIGFSEKL